MHELKKGKKVGAKFALELGMSRKTTGYVEGRAKGSLLKAKCSVHQSIGVHSWYAGQHLHSGSIDCNLINQLKREEVKTKLDKIDDDR